MRHAPPISLFLVRGDHRRAEDAGLRAVAGEPDRRVEAEARNRVLLRDPHRPGASSRSPADRDAAADDDLLRVEDVDRVGDADAEALAEDVEHAQRVGVAGLGAVDDVVAGDLAVLLEPLAEERVLLLARLALGEPVERAARREVLERPRQRVLALGRRRAVLEVEPDHRVAELARARRPAVEAPVEHQAATHAGADREHHEVRAHELARLVERLGERRARGVVLEVDRDPRLVRQQLAQRQVGERDVDAVRDPAGLELDDRGQADPDRDGVVGAQVGDQLDDLRDELVGVRHVGLDQLVRLELAVLRASRTRSSCPRRRGR